jgi:hypothetical protein
VTATGHEPGEFARTQARARTEAKTLRGRAVRTVAEQAVDIADFRSLLSMLGLDDHVDSTAVLRGGLAGYVRAVAAAVRVPPEGTGFEVSDTVTAYLGLAERWRLRPGRDLMLVWTEWDGWSVAVETGPAESSVVVDYFGGEDVVPAPAAVARFVSDVLAGRRMCGPRPAVPTQRDRDELAVRLNRYVSEAGPR